MRFRIVEMYSLKILIRTNLRLNVVFTENHNLMEDFTLKFVLKVFWCYQGLINGNIGQKWVNVKCFHRSLPFCLFYKKKIPWQLNSACLLSNCFVYQPYMARCLMCSSETFSDGLHKIICGLTQNVFEDTENLKYV